MPRFALINRILIVSGFVLLLAGCGDDKAKGVTAVPVTSVAQQEKDIAQRLEMQKVEQERSSQIEGEAAERKRFVQIIQTPVEQWSALYNKMDGGTLRQMIELGKQMQGIRDGLSTVSTVSCTAAARDTILRGMDAVAALIAGIEATKGESVPADIAVQFAAADAVVKQGAAELRTCERS